MRSQDQNLLKIRSQKRIRLSFFPHNFPTIPYLKKNIYRITMIAYKLAFLTLFAVQTFALDLQSSQVAPVAMKEGFENEEKVADAANTSTADEVCFTICFFTK